MQKRKLSSRLTCPLPGNVKEPIWAFYSTLAKQRASSNALYPAKWLPALGHTWLGCSKISSVATINPPKAGSTAIYVSNPDLCPIIYATQRDLLYRHDWAHLKFTCHLILFLHNSFDSTLISQKLAVCPILKYGLSLGHKSKTGNKLCAKCSFSRSLAHTSLIPSLSKNN